MRVDLLRHFQLLASLLSTVVSLPADAQAITPAQIVPYRSTPIISTAPANASPATQPLVNKTATTGGGSASTGQVWLQFINADIAVVARSLGAMTDKQVLVDSRVEGQMSLQSAQPVSPSVAWELFYQALQAKKLSIVLSQGAYLITPQTAVALKPRCLKVNKWTPWCKNCLAHAKAPKTAPRPWS